MSKAIEGAALLAGAVAVGALEYGLASTGVGLAALPVLFHVQEALVAGGIAMEAGAIAGALTNNRGMDITTRQAAGARQIIYGMQRVGGNMIYASTTGSKKDQYNRIIVIAGHPIWAIQSLYLDGRLVYFTGSGTGNTTQNGYNFGGNANDNTYTGPNGVQYNFGSGAPGGTWVYCEARYGTQASGDVIASMTANDGNWAADGDGNPYVGGCTYVYLKVEYSTSLFPSDPEIRFTVLGKPVYDPRTGETVWSANAALICADWWLSSGLGLAVNQAQLIAAANVCDEQIALAAGGTESQYCCHHHFDSSAPPSDIFKTLLKSMNGRHAEIGGELYLWPRYYQGPSAAWNESILTDAIQWDSTAAYKNAVNRVTGTYTAPNFPYNIAGNYYDSNGFADGMIQNNFQFGFQPDSFPQYACDPAHGFPADEFLNRDSGVTAAWTSGGSFALGQIVSYTLTTAGVEYASCWRSLVAGNTGNTPGPGSAYWANAGNPLPLEVNYNMVLSISQAQRLAKQMLVASRFWGRGTFEMGLAAYTMQDLDTFEMTSAAFGWTDKILEVLGMTLKVVTREGNPGEPPPPPEVRLSVMVGETDASIYEWSTAEEQNIYGVPTLPQQQNNALPAPPTGMALTSGATTATVAPDGTVTPRIKVTWTTPLDAYVTQIQTQYQLVGASSWTDGPVVDVSLNTAYLSPVTAGAAYNVQIRSVRPSGSASVWEQVLNFTAGLTVSNTLGQIGLAPSSLVPEGYTDGYAGIECTPVTVSIGTLRIALFPSGPYTITVDGTIGGSGASLAQQQDYYVYYIDPNVAGGNVTPIATTNAVDFQGKQGYFLIGTCITPYASSSGGSGRMYPGSYSDSGTRSTVNPTYAYDGNLSTASVVSSAFSYPGPTLGSRRTTFGLCAWTAWPAGSTSSDRTLYIVLAANMSSTGSDVSSGSVAATVTVNGTTSTPISLSATTAENTYTVDVPAGTDLSSVSVSISAQAGFGSTIGDSASASASVVEIYIQ